MSNRVYERYKNCSFDNFISDVDISILKNPKELKNNVVITGSVGTGKTHLAYAILNLLEEKRQYSTGNLYYSSKYVVYASIKEIIDNIKRCWDKNSNEFDLKTVDDYKKKPLLIIDEIGVQYGTESERVELFNIINERYSDCLPIIVISNYNKEQITKTLGLRITDRLYGGAYVIELTGKSHR